MSRSCAPLSVRWPIRRARRKRERFGAAGPKGFKALLAQAPLEGIDLERVRDFGRDADA